jgi:hypothetical protein
MTRQRIHAFLTYHWSRLDPNLLFAIEKRTGFRSPYVVQLWSIIPDKEDEMISEEDFTTETGAFERFERKIEMHYEPDEESAISGGN